MCDLTALLAISQLSFFANDIEGQKQAKTVSSHSIGITKKKTFQEIMCAARNC